MGEIRARLCQYIGERESSLLLLGRDIYPVNSAILSAFRPTSVVSGCTRGRNVNGDYREPPCACTAHVGRKGRRRVSRSVGRGGRSGKMGNLFTFLAARQSRRDS